MTDAQEIDHRRFSRSDFCRFRNRVTLRWDQRGEGKTLEATGPGIAPTMSVASMTQDGIAVAQCLRGKLHKHKIVLLGHSWGSILGIHMVAERPDLFSAYIGTRQVSNMERSLEQTYAATLQQARNANNAQSVSDLQTIGPPPYKGHLRKIMTLFNELSAFSPASDRGVISGLGAMILTAPNYSLKDVYYRNLGFTTVPTPQLYGEMLSTDLRQLRTFKMPIFFFQGAEDNIAVPSLAKQYLDAIKAPRKAFVSFAGGGHFIVWSMPDKFLAEMKARISR